VLRQAASDSGTRRNIACVPLAVAGYLPAWLAGLGMAASSLLVVLNALRLSAGARQAVAA
jgi:Cu2+-exporting ATPase